MSNKAKLSKRIVDQASAKSTDYLIWDNDITGFFVKIARSSRKTYGLYYRSNNGNQKRPTIGLHGKITTNEARQIAKSWLLNISEFGSHQKPIDDTNGFGNLSVKDLHAKYMAVHAASLKPTTEEMNKGHWKNHILPALGKMHVADVRDEDILKALRPLRERAPTHNRVRSLLIKAFRLAERWGMRPRGTNPAEDVPKLKEAKGRRKYLTPEEIRRLGEAIQYFRSAGGDHKRIADLVFLLLLSGARKREIMHAKWEWLDPEAGGLHLPDSKTGPKFLRLPDAAIAFMDTLKRVSGNPYLFPGDVEGQPLISERRSFDALRTHADLPSLRLHDLRHTFASSAKSSNVSMQAIASLLGHSDTSMTELYADLFDDKVKDAHLITSNALIEWLGHKKGC